ncbi:MAG: cytochrome c [Acidobacteriota bacterium]|nr:cytochrome c [Acidobacteriota bacterium]
MSGLLKPFGVLAAVAALGLATPVPAAAQAAAGPTFAKDIAPIFQNKCEACHRPDSIAPMSLVTYEESRPWARSIKNRVQVRQMPPWHIDKTTGIQEFQNDRSLSDKEIETIAKWVDAGAPKGDPKDLPPPVKWPSEQGWNYASHFGQAEPDLIIKSLPWTQKAGANDAWWKPVVETGLTEPRWVRAIELRPGSVKGRKITHHAIARLQQVETDELAANPLDANGNPLPGTFMEWAVGKQGEMMRPGAGKLMLPGSRIVWDVHYSNGGEDITDHVELGIYFYPKGQEPKYRQVLHLMGGTNAGGSAGLGSAVDIPPNSVKATVGYFLMRENGRVESFQPHMHLRGKAMSMEAILPNGQIQVLSHVADFNFNWHNTYVYAETAAPLLPKGTLIKVTGWHDNTAANKANPDPNVWVGYGDRTVDEMAHAWVNVTYLSDADYRAEIATRSQQLGLTTAARQQQ